MSEILFIVLFLAFYLGALVVEYRYGKAFRWGEEWTFFLAFILSPLLVYFLFRLFPRVLND
ncbi:MAG TPA: hypothetical protein ENF21_01945 [Bacteroidetes bacterium]|nr:hypothetical protein [Bacteroidota bacterium]